MARLVFFLDAGSALKFQIVILVISYFKSARQRQQVRVGTRKPKHEVFQVAFKKADIS